MTRTANLGAWRRSQLVVASALFPLLGRKGNSSNESLLRVDGGESCKRRAPGRGELVAFIADGRKA